MHELTWNTNTQNIKDIYDTFYDIKKWHIFLEENIDLYFLPYIKLDPGVISFMRQDISNLYDSSTLGTGSKLKQDEFILSRWLYKRVMESVYGRRDEILRKNEDSSINSPEWCSVSLSHKKGDILLGISSKYKHIGVDIERAVREELEPKILNQDEYKFLNTDTPYSKEVVLGLVFSFKESIFKAYYPVVRRMLYFKDASIVGIDYTNQTIEAFLTFTQDTIRGKFLVNPRDNHMDIVSLAWIL